MKRRALPRRGTAVRWTTRIGIVVGGSVGAMAALLGAPDKPPVPVVEAPPLTSGAGSAKPLPAPTAPQLFPADAAQTSPALSSAAAPAALDPPIDRAQLLKSELLCDQKQDFDECGRAAQAYEAGSAGSASPAQAKRFRRIALTHLVAQCEGGSPHACFVLAAKYRSGTELKLSLVSAEALEKRALELCRLRPASECPPSPG